MTAPDRSASRSDEAEQLFDRILRGLPEACAPGVVPALYRLRDIATAPSETASSEGYPGIAHDLETMRTALEDIVAAADADILRDDAADGRNFKHSRQIAAAKAALKNAAPQGSAGTHRTDPAGPVADDAHAPAGAAPERTPAQIGADIKAALERAPFTEGRSDETPRVEAETFIVTVDGAKMEVIDAARARQLESELSVANENRRLQAEAIRDYESELAEANRRAHYEATWHNHYALKEQSASSTESWRCEQCDPSFGCFAGSKPCSKVAPSSTSGACKVCGGTAPSQCAIQAGWKCAHSSIEAIKPNLIRQQDSGGCIVASLAMVCGMTYEEVRAKVHNFIERNSANHTDIESFLSDHGYAWQQKWMYAPGNVKRSPWPPEPWADVHLVNVKMPSGNSHQVVMLLDGTVLDPLTDEPKRLTDYPEVYNVTAIYKLPINTPKPFHEWKAGEYAKDQAAGTPRTNEQYYRAYGGYCNKVRQSTHPSATGPCTETDLCRAGWLVRENEAAFWKAKAQEADAKLAKSATGIPMAIRMAVETILNHVEPGWDNSKTAVRLWLDGKWDVPPPSTNTK